MRAAYPAANADRKREAAHSSALLKRFAHTLLRMRALTAHLRGIGAPAAFTASFLEEELLRMLIPIYQPGVIYQPDDFQELATILRQYC